MARPAGKPNDSEQRKFVLYKIFSQEIAFWRSVAENRRAEGVRCCSCCAAVGPIDICQACQAVLDDPNRYTWLKRCLKGKAPFEATELSKSEMRERLVFFQRFRGIRAFYMCQGAQNLLMTTIGHGFWTFILV